MGLLKKYEDECFVETQQPVWNYSLFTEEDIRNFQAGTHSTLYRLFGNKQLCVLNIEGTYFSVWAPSALYVSVVSDFNNFDTATHPLKARLDSSGIWEGFIPNVTSGQHYKYHIVDTNGMPLKKGDPFAHYWEKRPNTNAITWQTNYQWQDAIWMQTRLKKNALNAPVAVYELHLASWMRPDKNNHESFNSYQQIAELLVPYIKTMGFTHVEFMPIMEHPLDESWGYQCTGFFAPTSRFGTPQEFAALIDLLHQNSIGVILDWVPSHFPHDAHGLYLFDGNHTYEYADMRKGFHPDWNSYIFNYKRGEVKSFLISNAHFWCDQFHADGLRVDAVSSMLRLDYSRNEGQWEANELGGNANLEAIDFLRTLNETIYRNFPDIQIIAEEASDWRGISHPTYNGGLGFGMKWMMGWMHDTLNYFKTDPLFRKDYQNNFSFSIMYYYDEHFMLPLSHDEVVHGKSPMLYKMPGDEWQKFANLRLLYTYMYTHPGAKLLFMGNEFAATKEWNFATELQWDLLQCMSHGGMKYCVQQLNWLYRNEPALHEKQYLQDGFEWIDLSHRNECVVAYKRMGNENAKDIVVVLNLTPVVRKNWKLEVTGKNKWKEIFNSNDKEYWGSGDVYNPNIPTRLISLSAKKYELTLHLPPLGGIVLI